jgi:hypothetical protein
MISAPNRRKAIELIKESIAAGATATKACAELEFSLRTYQRWTSEEGVKTDGRLNAVRPAPANKLSPDERQRIKNICNQETYRNLPPSQIVPALADEGFYVASEASFYRVLREASQVNHRGKAQAPRTVKKPKSHRATAPNQVWSWDITFLATIITGMFYRLYLVMDIYSRKIVGWEIHENETACGPGGRCYLFIY